jgi:MFS family permease
MAALGGGVYLLQAVSAFATGWAHDRLLRRGETPNRIYKTTMAVSQLATAVCLAGVVVATTPELASACLLLTGLAFGLGSSTLFASAQTLAGPTAAGRWVGFQNFVGNLAGVMGPAITGFLIDRTGHFSSAFALAITIAIIGLFSWTIVVPRIAPVAWEVGPRWPAMSIPVTQS